MCRKSTHKANHTPQRACAARSRGRSEGRRRCALRARAQGYEAAKKAALKFLETFKVPAAPGDRELLRCVARTSLRTKVYEALADQLTDMVVDAVLTIRKPDEPIDLFMARAAPAA